MDGIGELRQTLCHEQRKVCFLGCLPARHAVTMGGTTRLHMLGPTRL
mgnify:CR=1 FL=1